MSKILVIRHTVLDIINYKDNLDTRPRGIYLTLDITKDYERLKDDAARELN